jgi:hypothetical protein
LFSLVIVCSASYALDPEIGQPFPLWRLGLPSVHAHLRFFLVSSVRNRASSRFFQAQRISAFSIVVGGCFSIVVVNEEGSEHTCE